MKNKQYTLGRNNIELGTSQQLPKTSIQHPTCRSFTISRCVSKTFSSSFSMQRYSDVNARPRYIEYNLIMRVY